MTASSKSESDNEDPDNDPSKLKTLKNSDALNTHKINNKDLDCDLPPLTIKEKNKQANDVQNAHEIFNTVNNNLSLAAALTINEINHRDAYENNIDTESHAFDDPQRLQKRITDDSKGYAYLASIFGSGITAALWLLYRQSQRVADAKEYYKKESEKLEKAQAEGKEYTIENYDITTLLDKSKNNVNPPTRRAKAVGQFGDSIGQALSEIVFTIAGVFLPQSQFIALQRTLKGPIKLAVGAIGNIIGTVIGIFGIKGGPNVALQKLTGFFSRWGKEGWARYTKRGIPLGRAVGAAIGGVIGFFTPFPFGVVIGIAVGGAIGAVAGYLIAALLVPRVNKWLPAWKEKFNGWKAKLGLTKASTKTIKYHVQHIEERIEDSVDMNANDKFLYTSSTTNEKNEKIIQYKKAYIVENGKAVAVNENDLEPGKIFAWYSENNQGKKIIRYVTKMPTGEIRGDIVTIGKSTFTQVFDIDHDEATGALSEEKFNKKLITIASAKKYQVHRIEERDIEEPVDKNAEDKFTFFSYAINKQNEKITTYKKAFKNGELVGLNENNIEEGKIFAWDSKNCDDEHVIRYFVKTPTGEIRRDIITIGKNTPTQTFDINHDASKATLSDEKFNEKVIAMASKRGHIRPQTMSDDKGRTKFLGVGAGLGATIGGVLGIGLGIAFPFLGIPLLVAICVGVMVVLGAIIFAHVGPNIQRKISPDDLCHNSYDYGAAVTITTGMIIGSFVSAVMRQYKVNEEIEKNHHITNKDGLYKDQLTLDAARSQIKDIAVNVLGFCGAVLGAAYDVWQALKQRNKINEALAANKAKEMGERKTDEEVRHQLIKEFKDNAPMQAWSQNFSTFSAIGSGICGGITTICINIFAPTLAGFVPAILTAIGAIAGGIIGVSAGDWIYSKLFSLVGRIGKAIGISMPRNPQDTLENNKVIENQVVDVPSVVVAGKFADGMTSDKDHYMLELVEAILQHNKKKMKDIIEDERKLKRYPGLGQPISRSILEKVQLNDKSLEKLTILELTFLVGDYALCREMPQHIRLLENGENLEREAFSKIVKQEKSSEAALRVLIKQIGAILTNIATNNFEQSYRAFFASPKVSSLGTKAVAVFLAAHKLLRNAQDWDKLRVAVFWNNVILPLYKQMPLYYQKIEHAAFRDDAPFNLANIKSYIENINNENEKNKIKEIKNNYEKNRDEVKYQISKIDEEIKNISKDESASSPTIERNGNGPKKHLAKSKGKGKEREVQKTFATTPLSPSFVSINVVECHDKIDLTGLKNQLASRERITKFQNLYTSSSSYTSISTMLEPSQYPETLSNGYELIDAEEERVDGHSHAATLSSSSGVSRGRSQSLSSSESLNSSQSFLSSTGITTIKRALARRGSLEFFPRLSSSQPRADESVAVRDYPAMEEGIACL